MRKPYKTDLTDAQWTIVGSSGGEDTTLAPWARLLYSKAPSGSGPSSRVPPEWGQGRPTAASDSRGGRIDGGPTLPVPLPDRRDGRPDPGGRGRAGRRTGRPGRGGRFRGQEDRRGEEGDE